MNLHLSSLILLICSKAGPSGSIIKLRTLKSFATKITQVTCFFSKYCFFAGDTPEHVTLIEAVSLCDEQGLNWSLPVIQTEEAHQNLVRFMMEHNISSAWLGWQNVQLNNWTWIDGQMCK